MVKNSQYGLQIGLFLLFTLHTKQGYKSWYIQDYEAEVFLAKPANLSSIELHAMSSLDLLDTMGPISL